MPDLPMPPEEHAAYDEALKRIEECRREGTLGKALDLSGLKLTSLPPEIGQLATLNVFFLHDNQLTSLPPEIGQLSALRLLDLSSNQLTSLPPEIGQLFALDTLGLAGNQLTDLPSEMSQLLALAVLYISVNQFTSLPIWLGGLPNLHSLHVGVNPLGAELLKLAEGNSERLIKYLRLRFTAREDSQHDFRRFDEAKLLFIGPGEVGKTWLLSALQGRVPTEKHSTVGIEISRAPMSVPHPSEEGRNLQMNCWDFGGQDYYQITHQIFFSAKAVYLLIWKPRVGIDPDLITRLDRIKLSAGNTAKVLIVSTHADAPVPARIGVDALKERFGDLIWGFYKTDSAAGPTGTGIAELKTEIARAAAQLAGMEDSFSLSWHTAHQAIRATRKATMPFEDIVAVCLKHEVGRQEVTDLVGIMEVQGHAVYFADASEEGQTGMAAAENLVVLDPEWLAKAVGFVIKDKATIAASGVLRHSRLARIWKRDEKEGCPGYNKKLHGYLLWLMWKFDIAYRQNAQLSLVPELIERNRPDDLRWTPVNRPMEPEATLICRIPQEPPPRIVPALTAAVHPLRRPESPGEEKDTLDRNWREGFFLDTARRGSAFFELQDRDLRIVVRDKYPSNLIQSIDFTLEGIRHQRWPNLAFDLRVPCITKHDRSRCKGTFRKSVLELHRSEKLLCEECGERVDAAKMLDGFDAREEEVMEMLRAINLNQKKMQTQQHDLMAASYRFFQQALDPMRHQRLRAPCMFSILPEAGKTWQALSRLTENKVRVTCWCEHPDGPHPAAPIGSDEPPDYILTNPKAWLVKAGPYISWAAVLLKAFVPLAGTVIAQSLEIDAPTALSSEIALMNDAAKALPAGKFEVGKHEAFDSGLRMSPQIESLRHIHDALLAQVSADKRWGDLNPVSTKSGEVLWPCRKHAEIQQPSPQNLSA